MIKIIIIILLIYLIYKIPQFIEPFSNDSLNKQHTLNALKNYPDKSIDPLYDAKFKPECCPSPYSASTGCACMSSEQIAYLNSRGGNRSGDSEF